MTYQEQIKAIEDYMDASLGVNGEITRKAEEAVREMKAASGDLISRQAAIDAADKIIERDTSGNNDVVKAMTAWKMYVEALPSVQSDHIAEVSKKDIPSIFPTQMSGTSDKQVSILAEALDGCPLTDPCDRLWEPHGWCEEHCGENQQEPSKECWLKYAEVMASE